MVGVGTTAGKQPYSGQHFLLSAAARQLSIMKIASYSEEEAFDLFCEIRWADTDGNPVCPACDCAVVYNHWAAQKLKNKKLADAGHQEKPLRRLFTCKACFKQFTPTSGTVFHSRKMPMKTMLAGVLLYVNGVKGRSALELARDIDVSHKSAFIFLHKLREAIGNEVDDIRPEGEVEVDGVYVGAKHRNKNIHADNPDRRLTANVSQKRRVGIVMRQRGGRTVTYVAGRSESDGVKEIIRRVRPGSTIIADEARSWDPLLFHFPTMKRIDHSIGYSIDGISTNLAESYFSRLRRGERGIYHHINGPYLDLYMKEMAVKEDLRRVGNGEQLMLVISAVTSLPRSKRFAGRWQRRS